MPSQPCLIEVASNAALGSSHERHYFGAQNVIYCQFSLSADDTWPCGRKARKAPKQRQDYAQILGFKAHQGMP